MDINKKEVDLGLMWVVSKNDKNDKNRKNVKNTEKRWVNHSCRRCEKINWHFKWMKKIADND